jgi:hypothetical protein
VLKKGQRNSRCRGTGEGSNVGSIAILCSTTPPVLRTNAVNKSDAEACQWVALSALKEFRRRAINEGGNAVINLHSYYKRNDLSDPTRYDCDAGFVVGGVAFKGTVAKLAK